MHSTFVTISTFLSKKALSDTSQRKNLLSLLQRTLRKKTTKAEIGGDKTGYVASIVMARSTSSSFSNAVLIISPMDICHSEFFFLGLQ